MDTIRALNELLEKTQDEYARCEADLKQALATSTFFMPLTRVIAGLQAKLDTLEEMERWIKAQIRRQNLFNTIY